MEGKTRFSCSMRLKFAVALALFSTGLMLGVMLILEQNIRETLIRENIDKGIGIARGVAFNAEDPLLTGDDLYLFSAVKNASRSPGILYTVIVDRQGKVRAADDMTIVGKNYTFDQKPKIVKDTAEYRVQRTKHSKTAVLDLEVPIFSVADNPIRLGDIHLGLSEDMIINEVRTMRNRLIVMAAVALLLGALAAYLLAGLFSRPILALVEGVRAIGRGHLDQHIDLKRNDELGVLTDAFNDMASSLREKEYIKNTFERYVSQPLAREILKHKNELHLGGEEKEVTVLFTDIRKFTSLSEKMTPREVVEFLNRYFTEIVQAVGNHNGMVDKFMGDAVMILFGAPLPMGDDPMRAARCALDIKRIAAAINAELPADGDRHLDIGVGITTGPVVAGNIGSKNRMEYTVIGDNVNLASRLEGLNKIYGTKILVSESTRRAVADDAIFREIDYVQVKGKQKPVSIFELMEENSEIIRIFEEGLRLYRSRDFSGALQAFTEGANVFEDPPSRAFVKRCNLYLEAPPPETWSGVFVATSK